jgi:hypothetical protein
MQRSRHLAETVSSRIPDNDWQRRQITVRTALIAAFYRMSKNLNHLNMKHSVKFTFAAAALLLLGFSACNRTEDELINDRQAPEFVEIARPRTQGGEGVVKIRGSYLEVRSENSTHMHVRGTVRDNRALSQMRIDIHGSHDGHSHARIAAGELPPFRVDEVVDLGGVPEFNFDEDFYYDTENFRAGPYHVNLHAVDQAGNTTSFADGSSIIRGIYLKRPYMPLIAIDGDPEEALDELSFAAGEALTLPGFIQHRRGGLDLATTFVRVSVVEDDDHEETNGSHGHTAHQRIWGESAYLRDNTGAPLRGAAIPDFPGNQLPLPQLFAGDNAYTLSAQDNGMVLRLEVEDAGGNLAVREFTLNVN